MSVRHKAFAERLTTACDDTGVPSRNFGRLRWIREKLSKDHGCEVTIEAVRKWLAGEALPRKLALSGLASLLSVDEGWLYSGPSQGMRETATAFDGLAPEIAPAQGDPDFLDRIRRRFAGTVMIMPGVDLTDPTWEEVDESHE